LAINPQAWHRQPSRLSTCIRSRLPSSKMLEANRLHHYQLVPGGLVAGYFDSMVALLTKARTAAEI
jgi:hypothetical protein